MFARCCKLASIILAWFMRFCALKKTACISNFLALLGDALLVVV